MKSVFRIFTLTLILGIAAIIGFGFDVDHTTSTTEASITTDSHERGSPTTEQSDYNRDIANIIGITTTETAIHATSPAALYFTNTANHSVTSYGLIGAVNVNYVLIGSATYRQVNISRYPVSPTPTDMSAALSTSYSFGNTVFVTAKEVELASSSFL